MIAPLGFDWKMGIGIITSFAAREVFVSTMSTVYNVGRTDHQPSSLGSLVQTLQAQKRSDGTPVYTPLTAVTLMVFYVFALQCVSTVAIVRRETNSWKWMELIGRNPISGRGREKNCRICKMWLARGGEQGIC